MRVLRSQHKAAVSQRAPAQLRSTPNSSTMFAVRMFSLPTLFAAPIEHVMVLFVTLRQIGE